MAHGVDDFNLVPHPTNFWTECKRGVLEETFRTRRFIRPLTVHWPETFESEKLFGVIWLLFRRPLSSTLDKIIMNSDPPSYRSGLISVIGTLASGEEQLDYEKRVPIAYVPGELLCDFFDGNYHPKSAQFVEEFSEDELKEIGVFSGYLQIAYDEVNANGLPVVTEVLKLPRWREMMGYATKTVTMMKKSV